MCHTTPSRRHKASAQAFRARRSPRHTAHRCRRRHKASAQAFRDRDGNLNLYSQRPVADTKPLRRHFEAASCVRAFARAACRRHKASAQAFREVAEAAAALMSPGRRHKASARAFRARMARSASSGDVARSQTQSLCAGISWPADSSPRATFCSGRRHQASARAFRGRREITRLCVCLARETRAPAVCALERAAQPA